MKILFICIVSMVVSFLSGYFLRENTHINEDLERISSSSSEVVSCPAVPASHSSAVANTKVNETISPSRRADLSFSEDKGHRNCRERLQVINQSFDQMLKTEIERVGRATASNYAEVLGLPKAAQDVLEEALISQLSLRPPSKDAADFTTEIGIIIDESTIVRLLGEDLYREAVLRLDEKSALIQQMEIDKEVFYLSRKLALSKNQEEQISALFSRGIKSTTADLKQSKAGNRCVGTARYLLKDYTSDFQSILSAEQFVYFQLLFQ